jgi:RNA polymerase sigma-70 factor (ECF subfamily)
MTMARDEDTMNQRRGFETTDWTEVVRPAGQGSQVALERLCAIYWYPVYAFYRRKRARDEARDLSQGFFARLIDKNEIPSADPERGRFRTWLLTAAISYLSNEDKRQRALKRGGRAMRIAFDDEDGECRYARETVDDLTPEQLYHRAWAQTVLDRALMELGRQYEVSGKGPLFEELARCITGTNTKQYRELAHERGMEENAFRLQVHRCRRRLRVVYDEIIAGTQGPKEDLAEERRFVLEALLA